METLKSGTPKSEESVPVETLKSETPKSEESVPVETLKSETPKDDAGRFVSVQRLPYKSPVLIEYGKVSKLTESAGSRNGDAGHNMMPCL
ncbi:MAG TPA: hypothetical protein VL127_00170 [Bryobacteraceae bacterium]|nr:hypothetical protein [Bryobacteraceae bacterium]